MMDEFKLKVLASTEGQGQGWPFARLSGGRNDPAPWIDPALPEEIRLHILGHTTLKDRTFTSDRAHRAR